MPIDYEISAERVSSIDSLWAVVEGLHLTDRGEWRKLNKTHNYQALGRELQHFIDGHSANEIQSVYRILGYTLVRLNESLNAHDPLPVHVSFRK